MKRPSGTPLAYSFQGEMFIWSGGDEGDTVDVSLVVLLNEAPTDARR